MIYIGISILILVWTARTKYWFLWSMLATTILLVGAGVLSVIYVKPHSHTDTQYIYSLSRDMNTHGNFVLGSGSVNTDPVYIAYRLTKNGGYTITTIPAKGTEIFLDSQEGVGRVNIITTEYENTLGWWVYPKMQSSSKKVIMHLPKETHFNEFKL